MVNHLTALEAAAELGVSLKTICNLCWSGRLTPASGTTRRDFRFTADEIERRKRERMEVFRYEPASKSMTAAPDAAATPDAEDGWKRIAEERYGYMRQLAAQLEAETEQKHDAWRMRAEWKRRAERWKEAARVYRKAGRVMSETAVFGESLLERGWRPFIRAVWAAHR